MSVQHPSNPANYLLFQDLKKVMKTFQEQREIAKSIAPDASFVELGTDNEYIYFKVATSKEYLSEDQERDLIEKTRFFVELDQSNETYYIKTFRVML